MAKKMHGKSKKKPDKNRRTQSQIQEADLLIDRLLDEGEKPAYIATILAERYHINPRQVFKDVKRIKETRSLGVSEAVSLEMLSEIKHKADYVHRKALRNDDLLTALKSQDMVLKVIRELKKGVLQGGSKREDPERNRTSLQLEDIVRALENDGKTD